MDGNEVEKLNGKNIRPKQIKGPVAQSVRALHS